MTTTPTSSLMSGNEAIAAAARDAGFTLGIGYPGTPSTEILEYYTACGGRASWAPNEKVALEVGLGVAFAAGRALVTMKHVGLNVAADVIFTAAYTGVSGALVVVSADDPGMHSSQNEQDNRRYAVAAGVPMFEPADAQEAYDYTHAAVEVSERWGVPVLLRVTTRVCHTTALVRGRHTSAPTPPRFSRNPQGLVMIPAHARPAHKRLRAKLDDIQRWNEKCAFNAVHGSGGEFGIITSGVCYLHAREAAPNANILKLGMTHPLPIAKIRNFRQTVERCWVIEENDPYLAEAIRAAGIEVECAPAEFRFGELNVDRVRRILTHATAPDLPLAPGRPPQLCQGCPHRVVFETLRELDVIVAGDIGCYTLGVLPPFEAMDTMVEMGAAIGVGLGLRHALPPSEAQRVVSVIGDSTFIHSGITGLVEMVYNPPATGHVVIILDNGTTAMTGLQEHPGTGRALGGRAAAQVLPENLARAVGIQDVTVVDAVASRDKFSHAVRTALAAQRLSVIIVRRPCLLLTRHRTTAGQEA